MSYQGFQLDFINHEELYQIGILDSFLASLLLLFVQSLVNRSDFAELGIHYVDSFLDNILLIFAHVDIRQLVSDVYYLLVFKLLVFGIPESSVQKTTDLASSDDVQFKAFL